MIEADAQLLCFIEVSSGKEYLKKSADHFFTYIIM
jgi:hypothetical protein